MSQGEAGGAERFDGISSHPWPLSKPTTSPFPQDTADESCDRKVNSGQDSGGAGFGDQEHGKSRGDAGHEAERSPPVTEGCEQDVSARGCVECQFDEEFEVFHGQLRMLEGNRVLWSRCGQLEVRGTDSGDALG